MQDIVRSIRNYLEMEKESGIEEYLFSTKIKKTELALLKKRVIECQKCPLAKIRNNVVFGEGDMDARLMFIG